jgi:hypothetical protein
MHVFCPQTPFRFEGSLDYLKKSTSGTKNVEELTELSKVSQAKNSMKFGCYMIADIRVHKRFMMQVNMFFECKTTCQKI